MKTLFQYRVPLAGSLFALIVTLVVAELTTAAVQQKEARVTQVIKDVRLLPSGASPKPASINDFVRSGMAVRTGIDSRTELTFADQSLTRLGANSVFSFSEGGKNFDLSSGALLICVPKETTPTQVKVGAATAAVTGFTAMFEHHSNGWSKMIMLNGNGTISFRGVAGEPCELQQGQMVVWPPHPVRCPEILNVDLSKVLKGKLIQDFPPLPEIEEILKNIDNPPPGGPPIDPTNIDTRDQGANAMPTPIKTGSGFPGLRRRPTNRP